MSKYISFPLDNTYYSAEAEQLYNSNRTNGVFSRDNEFKTTFKGGMVVTVSGGRAWLHTSDMTGFIFGSFEPVDLTLDIGDNILNRIDRILIRHDFIANTTSLKVLKGTPASNPVAPPIIRDVTTYYDLCIAEIRINAGTIILNQGMISDKRLDESLCGVVKDGIESIPTQSLQDQWENWFDNLQNELNNNQATNLQNQINKVNSVMDEKMDKNTTDIAIYQLNKTKGKIDESFLTDELIQKITGNTSISNIIADRYITPIKNAYPTVVGKYTSKNLIDINLCKQGYYVDYLTGQLKELENYYASDFVPVVPMGKYRINYNEQFAYYDSNKSFISGVSGSANHIITIPEGVAYARFSVKDIQLDTVQFEKGEKITSYQSGLPVIPYEFIEKKVTFIVGENEEIKKINDAIQLIRNLDINKQYTIIIKDGVYLENINLPGNTNINIIGINKETCIIEDRSGDYNKAPLSLNGNGYFKNLTFYSNHKDGVSYDKRSYAMHFEGDHGLGTGTYCEFDNCKFISEQNSAVGIGMRKDETLRFRRCEFIQRDIDKYDAGSLYMHSSQFNNDKNQKIIFEECKASNDSGFILGIDDSNSMPGGEGGASIGDCTIEFINNNFWSSTNGKNPNSIKLRGASASEGCIIGRVKISERSFGNNISILNK